MTRGFFVTGTDTHVGKTVLSATLVAALDAVYWKPIQTGSSEGTDRQSVIRYAELPEERALPECYTFGPPVSPHLAARLAGARIDLGKISVPAAPNGRPLIVEGAGGALVPLNESEMMTDLMVKTGLPVLVAARTTLGTINHTLLTLAALRAAELTVRGVVMIGEENRENHGAIEQYGRVRVLGRIPPLEKIDRHALLGAFEKYFSKDAFP